MLKLKALPMALLLALGAGLPASAEGLVDVYRLAEQNDASLRAAAQGRLAAREGLPQARAQLLPNVSVTAGLNRDWLAYPQNSARDDSYTSQNYTLNLTQPLFDRARFTARDQAERVAQRADVDYANSQQELLLRASDGYFAVLRAQAELKLAQADLAAAEKRLEQTEKRFEVGLIAITDLADARSARDQSTARRIGAETLLANAHEALRVITAQDITRLDDVRDDLNPVRPDPMDPQAWAGFAEQQNLALQSAQMAADIARQEVEKQRSGHYPTVNLNASYGYQDTQFAGAPVENYDTRVGVQLNLPLYTAGGTESRIREATYTFQQAQDGYEAARRDTVRATRNAYRTVSAKIGEIEAFAQGVKSAETQLAANEAGYEVGTRTIVDVITAQSLLTQAQRNLFNARYDYLLATLNLKRAAGTLALADLEALQRELR
ncbi:MAG: TolC family outer membrane protein [Halothiobacillaceae bacterium]|nr:MAG: TolC family outer membrane protein [Halothiobacillaceae bacterium]